MASVSVFRAISSTSISSSSVIVQWVIAIRLDRGTNYITAVRYEMTREHLERLTARWPSGPLTVMLSHDGKTRGWRSSSAYFTLRATRVIYRETADKNKVHRPASLALTGLLHRLRPALPPCSDEFLKTERHFGPPGPVLVLEENESPLPFLRKDPFRPF